jgi:hypothetical protein
MSGPRKRRILAFQHAAPFGLRLSARVGPSGPRLSATLWPSASLSGSCLGALLRVSEKVRLSGPFTAGLRIVYNCRDGTRLGGTGLICTGLNAYRMAWGMLMLLVLAALAATIFGCGGAGGGGSSNSPRQQASETAEPSGRKSEDAGSSGGTAAQQPGHPTLGSAGAPVVLTEYSDYQ